MGCDRVLTGIKTKFSLSLRGGGLAAHHIAKKKKKKKKKKKNGARAREYLPTGFNGSLAQSPMEEDMEGCGSTYRPGS